MQIDDQLTWWGVEHGDQVADSVDVFWMIYAGVCKGLPAPIAVDTRPWAAETIIRVAPSHRDDWREWWRRRGAGPWAVTQHRHDHYIHYRSHGHWRGWRIVILHVEEDNTAIDRLSTEDLARATEQARNPESAA